MYMPQKRITFHFCKFSVLPAPLGGQYLGTPMTAEGTPGGKLCEAIMAFHAAIKNKAADTQY